MHEAGIGLTLVSLTDVFGNNTDKEPEQPSPFYPKEVEESELFELGVKIGVNFEAYDKIPIKVTGDGSIPAAVPTFQDMNLRKVLLDNVVQAEYSTPTPIQKHAIPILMNERDLMACAQTGSGKTVRTQNYIQNIICQSLFSDNSSSAEYVCSTATRQTCYDLV